jgi:inactivated superfamily I helicase
MIKHQGMVTLSRCRQQLQWMSEQLSAETVKRRQMEEENMALQHRLEGLLDDDHVLVERQTLAVIQQVFQKFIKKVHDTWYIIVICSINMQ